MEQIVCDLSKKEENIMNVLFFLTPKEDVAYIYHDYTVRQALEKMKYYHYTAIPMIDREGHYMGTVTEGDFLWGMLEHGAVDWKDAENYELSDLTLRRNNQAVQLDADIEDLLQLALQQNFVPVVDAHQIFIGIVTRKDILQYFSAQVFAEQESAEQWQEQTVSSCCHFPDRMYGKQ